MTLPSPRGRMAATTMLSVLLAFLAAPGVAEEASVRPGVNSYYLVPDVDVDTWVERFEGESREIFQLRHAIAAAVDLEPGMEIADVGAGTGLFVPLFADRVGTEGRVFAADISPRFVQHIRDRVAEAGLEQVTVVLSAERSVTLPAASVDVVFLCDVYHHFEYPQTVLASILRALRPGGQLVLLDFERIPGTTRRWILDHVRAGRETVMEEIAAAGFTLTETLAVEGLTENYMLRFTAP